MLLIDIGSTYTKLAVADTETADIVATSAAPTTVADVSVGFRNALAKLEPELKHSPLLNERYASSSAAGGLRMVAIGLVPDLTMEAAKRAALGAGAKIVGTFSFQLSKSQIEKIVTLTPDIILLAGGTDGGERATVVHNASVLAASQLSAPVVMAGNSQAADEVAELFQRAGKQFYVTENVMPRINRLNVDAVRDVIREIFIKHIIVAKGLDKINDYINGIALPTPLAVLEAAKTIAEVAGRDVIVVDVGGATTDVHSISDGLSNDQRVVFKGLPEPYAKRTVEGDLGVRHNIASIVAETGRERFLSRLNTEAGEQTERRLDALLEHWADRTENIAENAFEEEVDCRLAECAVEIAMNRHCGYIEEIWTPDGKQPVQYGKDLTTTGIVVGTGGPLINSRQPKRILNGVMYDQQNPFFLKPKKAEIFIDRKYVLFSIGLIRQTNAELARRMASNYSKAMEV